MITPCMTALPCEMPWKAIQHEGRPAPRPVGTMNGMSAGLGGLGGIAAVSRRRQKLFLGGVTVGNECRNEPLCLNRVQPTIDKVNSLNTQN